jgi:hypothetical protein
MLPAALASPGPIHRVPYSWLLRGLIYISSIEAIHVKYSRRTKLSVILVFNNGDLLYGRFRVGAILPGEPPEESYVAKDEQDGNDYVIRCFPIQTGQLHNIASRVLQFVERRQKLTDVPWPDLIDGFVDRNYVYLQQKKPSGYGFEEWCNRHADPGYSMRPDFIRLLLNGLAAIHSAGSDLYHGGFKPEDIVVNEAGRPLLNGEKWSGQAIGLRSAAPAAMRKTDLDSLAKMVGFCFPHDGNGSPAWDQVPQAGRAPVFLARCLYECLTGNRTQVTDAAMLLPWIAKLEQAGKAERDQGWPEAAALYEEAAKTIEVPALKVRAGAVQELARPKPAPAPKPDNPKAEVPKELPKKEPPPPPLPTKPSIKKFEASAANVTAGEVVRLSWVVENAAKVDIQPELGERQASGIEATPVHRTTTFILKADGPGGSETRSVTVRAEPRPAPSIDLFQITPAAIKPGGSATIRWAVQNATSTTILPDIGIVDLAGEREVAPADSTTYQLIVVGAGASLNRQVILTVAQPPRIESFSAHPVGPGTFRIAWQTSGSGVVDIQPGLGLVPPSGQRDVRYAQPTTLKLAATGALGQHAEATVTAIAPPPPAGRFKKWAAIFAICLALGIAVYLLRDQPAPPQTKSPSMQAGDKFGPKPDPAGPAPAQDTSPQTVTPPLGENPADDKKTGLPDISSAPRPAIQFGASELEIPRGRSTLLSWTVKGATQVLLEPGSEILKPSGSKSVSPDSTTEYKLVAHYPGGETFQSLTINVIGAAAPQTRSLTAPRISEFKAEPPVIAPGRTVVLSWTVEGANRVSLQPEPGMVEASGSRSFTLPATKKFTLVAEANGAAPTQQDIWVTVDPRLAPPSDPTFSATPAFVSRGATFTLRWQAPGATAVFIELARKPDQSLATLPQSSQPSIGQLSIPVDDQFTRYGLYEYKLTAQYGAVTKEKRVSVMIVRSGQ